MWPVKVEHEVNLDREEQRIFIKFISLMQTNRENNCGKFYNEALKYL